MPRKENEEITSLRRITKKGLRDLCKKNKLYQTPELNDVLYLHYQGFQDIECLEEYTGLKCLWLESNAISDIKGLDNQKQLKCLFLHNNLIRKIENLDSCRELDTLNLSNNHISRIENCGVDKLPVLTTLNLAHNYLKCMEDLQNLTECTQLSVLDLANNRIEDILIVKILAKMPELRVLVLTGNPVVSRIPQYRKTLILECKELTYLDSRPVFPRDRACAEAWKRGGYEEERREHEKWNKADRKKIRDSVNATLRLRNRGGGDPQVDLIATSSDEDEGLTERSSAPMKEDLQHMSTEEVNAEIIELMRLGDLVEYEQSEKCTKESVNNEEDNEIEDLKCNPCIINQAKALPENKLISAAKSPEDATMEENSEALERYGKTYKQAYDNYLEYVQILMNQDTSGITSDQDKNNGEIDEFEVKNTDNIENKMNNNESDDFNQSTEQNLISTLNDEQISSPNEPTTEDLSNSEVEKDSQQINFIEIQNKDNFSTEESDNGKIEDLTDSGLNQPDGKVKDDLLLESQASSNLPLAPEENVPSVKDEISISSMSYMESYIPLNSQNNNLSMPSYLFPKIEDNQSHLSESDVESNTLEENPVENRGEDDGKTECRTIKEFITNYEQFLCTIDDRKCNEKKEAKCQESNKVDEDKSSNTLVDVDSDSAFKKMRFFVQNCPGIEKDEGNKLQIINRLLENPITKQLSSKKTCKTLEELDEELKIIQEEQTKWIQKMTDRCYSQKDRYNDDLNVINNQLVVFKKDVNNTSNKEGKEDSNKTSDEVGTQSQDLRQVNNFTEIEEGLQNDDSEIYEMACSSHEENLNEHTENHLGKSREIITCNENYSKSGCEEQANCNHEENVAKMGECQSNTDFFKNSERLSDSDSMEEYFMPPTGSPQKGVLSDIYFGALPTLEDNSEKIQKCDPSHEEKELQYDVAEGFSTLETNSEKELQYDFSQISSKLTSSLEEEQQQCNFDEKETDLQYYSAEIPSTSKGCSGKQRRYNFYKKEGNFHCETKYLEVISEEERQSNNSTEKEIDLQYDSTEMPSTSKACLEKQRRYNFSKNERDLQYDTTKFLTTEDAVSDEERKFYYTSEKEDELQYNAGEILLTLEASSEKKSNCSLSVEERDLQYDAVRDDPPPTIEVKELDNTAEKFEWIKSSILTLASGGMTEGSRGTEPKDRWMYSPDPQIDKIHRDIDEDFHKDLTSLFINASLEYKMIESAEKYGDPEEDSPFDIEQRAMWYLEELKNHLPPDMKELISTENKNWHRFSGDANEFRNSSNLDESPHIKKLHEILKSRNAVPGVVDKNKVLLKLVLANKDYLLNHKKTEARELAKKILKDNGIEEPDTDSASTEVNLSNTSAEVFEEKFST